MPTAHLAIDIGASGGTCQLGTVGTDTLERREIARFDNRPIRREDGRYVWDLDRLTDEVVAGIRRAVAIESGLDSIGIDTWGVDVGLLADGEPIRNPYAYRDPTAYGTLPEVLASVDRREIFEATGIAHWDARTTLPAYYFLARREPAVLAAADTLLAMPQLLATRLGARPCIDPTVASTTQLFDPRAGDWAGELLSRLDLPTDVLPEPVPPGTRIGTVDRDAVGEIDVEPPIVLPASHDTASAVAALPFRGDDRAFLATGTVFILGVERPAPVLSDAAFRAGVSNELGVDGTVRVLKNLNNGFFLLEECRSVWRDQGHGVDYETLLDAASAAPPFRSLIDPAATRFDTVGEMPAKIRRFCAATDQPVPASVGAVTRCILESLAGTVALLIDDVLAAAEADSDRLHLCGGGVRNEPFCRMVADATGREVIAGPAEAATVGNLLVQARTSDSIASIAAGRRLVEAELGVDRYRPTDSTDWTDAIDRLASLDPA